MMLKFTASFVISLLISPQELQIGFSQYEHPVVLTVEAQVTDSRS